LRLIYPDFLGWYRGEGGTLNSAYDASRPASRLSHTFRSVNLRLPSLRVLLFAMPRCQYLHRSGRRLLRRAYLCKLSYPGHASKERQVQQRDKPRYDSGDEYHEQCSADVLHASPTIVTFRLPVAILLRRCASAWQSLHLLSKRGNCTLVRRQQRQGACGRLWDCFHAVYSSGVISSCLLPAGLLKGSHYLQLILYCLLLIA
jgi:hypothetical protein